MAEDTVNIFLAGARECKKGWPRGRQSSLAKAIGITDANLSGILSGTRHVSLEVQTRLAAELGKTYEDMLALGRKILSGEPIEEKTDSPPPLRCGQQESPSEQINLSEGRLMAEMVLVSNTRYAGALWANLKSFAEAVRKEAQVKELEKRVEDGFRESRSEIAELKEMIKALGGDLPVKKSQAA